MLATGTPGASLPLWLLRGKRRGSGEQLGSRRGVCWGWREALPASWAPCLGRGEASLWAPGTAHPCKAKFHALHILVGPHSKAGLHGGDPNTIRGTCTCVPRNSSSPSARHFPKHFVLNECIPSHKGLSGEVTCLRGQGQGLQGHPQCLCLSLKSPWRSWR